MVGNVTGEQVRGIALSAIMVLSMVALAFAGGAAGSPDAVAADADAGADATPTAEINETLLDEAADDPVMAVVRLDAADRTTLVGENEQVTAELQSHAEQAQQPVLSYADEHAGVEVHNQLWIANAVLVEADADGLTGLAELPGVDRIHPNFEVSIPDQPATDGVQPDEDEFTYGLEMINAPEVWDEFDTQGEGASVAVLDTGVDDDHPDLPELTDDQWGQWDDDGNPVDTDPNDGNGHGTHVSGTVVGSDDPDGDVPGFGVAPGATLYHGKVLDDGGGGTFAQILAGMEWAVDDAEADIVSMSLGATGFFDELIEPSENARDAGVVLVASAGNDGAGTTGSPGNVYPNFASGAVDANEDVASFSSGELVDTDAAWGNAAPDYWPDEYVVPNAAAPGVNVLSSVPGGGYDGSFSGTSMSAPHKAGTFALMMSFAPETDRDELMKAMETTAWKPDDWGEPDDEPDTRYGYGIIDASAAVSEVNPLTAESELGDVTETGEVSLTDAILIQEEIAGVRDGDSQFFEPAADLNRDGDIGLSDGILVQEKLAGVLEEGEIDVSNLDAPPFVTGGTPIDVSADLENLGDEGALENIEFRMAPEGEPLDGDAAVVDQFVDMATAGVDTPVSHPAEMTVEFEDLPTDGLPGGDYEHGVFSEHHNATDTITINAPYFEVTDLDAPAEVPQNDEFTVEAEVTNTGNVDETGDVTYHFAAAGVTIVEESVPIEAGESETITFDVEADVFPGTYEHGVTTADDETVANITVLDTYFEVTDLDAPTAVNVGEEITVEALVENVGGLADEQEITYDLADQISVAVVDETLSTDEIATQLAERTDLSEEERTQRASEIQSAADLSDFLADELDDDTFDVVDVSSGDLMDNTHHDVYVINQFTEDNDAAVFLDELGDSQATIHLDQVADDPTSENDGVVRLVLDVGDPEELNFAIDGSGADLHLGATPHPLFDGVGEPGDTVPLHTLGNFGDRGWHGNYSGEDLAQVSAGGNAPDGPAVAVHDEENQILLSSSGRDSFTPHDAFSEAEHTLVTNAVEYAAFEQALAGDSLTGVTTDDATETVQLDPGESETVTFEYTVQEADSGALKHVVSSDDDFATGPVEIAAEEQVNVVDLDAPAEVEQGEQLEVTATLEHVGTESTTQNATYLFDGETEDSEEVSLDPGETTEVTLSTEIPVDQTPETYEHGVALTYDEAFAFVDVVEAGEPFFDVDEFVAPDEVDPGEQITVSAQITNTGDLAGTQLVEYDFDVDVPELTPLDVAVVDLDSDDSRNGGLLVDLLDDELDENDSVTGYFEDDVADWETAVEEDEHDVHLVHSLATDSSLMTHFLDERGADTTGVLLDSWDDSGAFTADAIRMLSEVTADPAFYGEHLDGGQNAYTNVETDHPIFDGIADEGESFFVKSTDADEGAFLSMSDFSGQEIGTGSFGGGGAAPAETTTVVDYDRGLVLDGMLGGDIFEIDQFSEDAHQMIVNAVEYAGSGELSSTGTAGDDAVATEDDELQIAVVELAHTGGGTHAIDIENMLDDRLEDATIDRFYQDEIDGGQDADAWESQLNDYDIHVVQAWGTHHSEVGTEHVEYFFDNADESTAAIVLDSQGTSSTLHSDGITEVGNVTGDPGHVQTDLLNSGDGAWLHADTPHPIFEGVIDEGEAALMVNQDDDAGQFVPFSGTEAEPIGSGSFGEGGPIEGDTLAVDFQRQLVFNGMLGGDIWDPADYTDDAKDILANAVEYTDDVLLAEGEQFVSLEPGESETVEFDVTVPEVDPGEYGHGIFSEDDSATATVTVLQLDEFQLSNLDPETAEVVTGDDPIDVSVDVENVGAQSGEQDIELAVTDDETGDVVYSDTVEGVTLAPDETQTVTFEGVPAGALDRGDYTHTVTSDHDELSGSLDVFEPVFFEVSNLDAPAEVFEDETFDVSADVTNTIEEISVGVVESSQLDPAPLVGELEDRTDDRFVYETVDSGDLLDDPALVVGEYEVIVVSDLLDDGDLPDDDDVQAFVDAADAAGTGLVFAEQYSTVPITSLSSATDDPETAADGFGDGDPLVQVEQSDHPVFAGIDDDEFLAHEGLDEDYHFFENYSGEVLADVAPGGDVVGGTVAVDDDSDHVLVGTAVADGSFVFWDDLTEESWTLLANSVDYLAAENTGESVSPDYTDTQTIEYVFDGTVEDTEEVTLDAGETKTVTFEDIPADAAPGEYEHGVHSEDDGQNATVSIVQGAEYLLSNLDPEDGEVGEDDDFIDISADVENAGDTTQPADVLLEVLGEEDDGEPEPTADVAVVNPVEDDSVSYLMDRLESDTTANAEFVESDTLIDDPNAVMSDYDGVVFLHYGYWPTQDDVEDIRLASRDTNTGLVHLDPGSEEYGDFFGNAMWGLFESLDVDPAPSSIMEIGVDDEESVEVVIEEESTLFDGIGGVGDSFDIRPDDGAFQGMNVFSFEEGVEAVGTGVDSEGTEDTIAAEDPNNPEVYLGVGADGDEQHFEDHTDEAHLLIANSIASVTEDLSVLDSEPALTPAASNVVYDDVVEDFELAPGETETVTFEDVPVGALDPGEYEHHVSTPDDAINGTLTVLEPTFFNVTNLDAPEEAESSGSTEAVAPHGTVNVSADVTNTLPPEPDVPVVSVVDSTFDDAQAGALVDHLADELDDDYIVEEVASDELLSTTDSDVYVIQEFGDTDAQAFLDLLGDDQAVVALDQHGTDADAVESLVTDTGDPGEFESDFAGGPNAELEITDDHPIFDGVGDQGDVLTYHEGFDADRAWFDESSGDTLGEIHAPADEIDAGGAAVGVNDDANQVLLPSSARTEYVIHDEFTAAEQTLVVNAVEHALDQAGATVTLGDDVDVAPDETGTQEVEYRIGNETLATQTVTLDAGETKTVTFDDVEVTVDPGEYEQGVYSNDDSATANITVVSPEGDGDVGTHDDGVAMTAPLTERPLV